MIRPTVEDYLEIAQRAIAEDDPHTALLYYGDALAVLGQDNTRDFETTAAVREAEAYTHIRLALHADNLRAQEEALCCADERLKAAESAAALLPGRDGKISTGVVYMMYGRLAAVESVLARDNDDRVHAHAKVCRGRLSHEQANNLLCEAGMYAVAAMNGFYGARLECSVGLGRTREMGGWRVNMLFNLGRAALLDRSNVALAFQRITNEIPDLGSRASSRAAILQKP